MAPSPTKEPTPGRRRKIAGRVAFAIALLAVIMVCSGLGKVVPSPFGPTSFQHPSIASSNEHATVIVDTVNTRVLFLDSSQRLVRAIQIDTKEVPISEISSIAQSGADVFIAGASRAADGENITSETVLHYDMQGHYKGKIWEKNYDDTSVVATNTISCIEMDRNGDVLVTRIEGYGISSLALGTQAIRVKADGSGETNLRDLGTSYLDVLYRAGYLADKDRYLAINASGRPLLENREKDALCELAPEKLDGRYQSIDVEGDEAVLYDNLHHTLLYTKNLFGDVKLTTLDDSIDCLSAAICGNIVTATLDSGEICLYDTSTGSKNTLKEAELTPILRFRAAMYYASVIYLVLFVIAITARWIITSFRKGRRSNIRHAVLSIGTSFIFIAAMTVHASEMFSVSFQSRVGEMSQISTSLGYDSPTTIGDTVNQAASRLNDPNESDPTTEDLLDVYRKVEGLLLSTFKSGMGLQCNIFSVSDDGQVRYLISNQRQELMGDVLRDAQVADPVLSVVKAAQNCEGNGDDRVNELMQKEMAVPVVHANTWGNMVAYVAPLIAKDGTCKAAVEILCHFDTFYQRQMDSLLTTLFAFAMVALAIYVLSEEIVTSGRAYIRYRELHEQGVEWAESLLGRPLVFIANLASTMDTALAVVIARDMLTTQGMSDSTFTWGMPALAITLGTTVGTLFHATMAHRITGRRLVLSLVLVAVAAQIGCGVAVVNGWFGVFIAGKFLSSAGYAGVVFVAKNISGQTKGKDVGSERLSVDVSRSAANVAGKGAAVISGVVGGFLAEQFGGDFVYFVAAGLGLSTIALFLAALPEGRYISKHGEEAKVRNIFSFVLSPIMLSALVFAIFPTVLASGYKTYLLPLFLDSAGISKADISGLFALGNAILYVLMNPLIAERNARGRWLLSWVALIGLGVTFLLYSYNQAPVWAVISIVVITLLAWLAGDWKHNARFWAKKDYGFSYDQSQAFLATEESVVKNAQSPVLTGLLTFGAPVCCLVLGVFFCISGVIYGFTTRKRGDFA